MKNGLKLLALTLAFVAYGAFAEDKLPQTDGKLDLVEHTELRAVYMLPGASLAKYDKVILVDCYVAFTKNYRMNREFGAMQITDQQMLTVKKNLAEGFKQEFTKELEKKGYSVVPDSAAASDVLIVRPAIINLDPQAPDPMGNVNNATTYSASAGSMTLYAELYDSVTSELLAKVIDPETDQGFGGEMMQQNTVMNKLAADRIINKWANALAGHLDHVIKN